MKTKSAEEVLDYWTIEVASYKTITRDNALKAMEEYADQFRPKENDNWRSDFNVYLDGLNKVYNELLNDKEWIKKQEELHVYPTAKIDIIKSLKKAVDNFYGTDAGWKYMKKKKIKAIDWKHRLTNSIDINKVWLPRESFSQQQQNVVYNKPKFLE